MSSFLSMAQIMKVHTGDGIVTFDAANVDSVTFEMKQDGPIDGKYPKSVLLECYGGQK